MTIDDLVIFAGIGTSTGPERAGLRGAVLHPHGALPVIGLMLFDLADVAQLETANSSRRCSCTRWGTCSALARCGRAAAWCTPCRRPRDRRTTPTSGRERDRRLRRDRRHHLHAGAEGAVGEHGRVGHRQRALGARNVLKNELMTGYLNNGSNPLRVLTVRSLADLGYPSTRGSRFLSPHAHAARGGRHGNRPEGPPPLNDVTRAARGPSTQGRRTRVTGDARMKPRARRTRRLSGLAAFALGGLGPGAARARSGPAVSGPPCAAVEGPLPAGAGRTPGRRVPADAGRHARPARGRSTAGAAAPAPLRGARGTAAAAGVRYTLYAAPTCARQRRRRRPGDTRRWRPRAPACWCSNGGAPARPPDRNEITLRFGTDATRAARSASTARTWPLSRPRSPPTGSRAGGTAARGASGGRLLLRGTGRRVALTPERQRQSSFQGLDD